MKKLFLIVVILMLQAGTFLYAETTYTSIKDEVDKKMKAIREGGGSGSLVTEIKIDKNKSSRETGTKPVTSSAPTETGYVGTLSALNIVAGMFEGGIIGAGCGLIGYSQSMNRDNMSLINGAIVGTSTGLILGAVLSGFEAGTGKYYTSEDFGYNLLGGTLIGAVLGTAGGFISYAKTDDLENVSEGIGYGVAVGATMGFILAIVELALPEQYRGGGSYGGDHSFIINNEGEATYLTYHIEY